MNKTAIKNFAVWARNKLIADISYKAGLLGITEKGIASALPQSTGTTEFYDIGTAEPYVINGDEIRQRSRLVELIERKAKETDYKTAYNYIIEEVAYTWFNRLIAIRFMEVNDYLPSHIRVLSSESGKTEPDLVTSPFDSDLDFTEKEKQHILTLKQENKMDELFNFLFVKQCNYLNKYLPKLFEETNDYTEILLNISVTDKEGVIAHLISDIDEADFDIEQGGQIEIIGWLYQYYNLEEFNEIYDGDMSKRKIDKENIPAATQLFTPDWVVKYMLENSLGRLWIEGHPNEILKKEWKYYIEEPEQEDSVKTQTDLIKDNYANISIEEIKVVDPCMGSGHILVSSFDILIKIYESCGYSHRDATISILENNLFGFDIDERAFQLSYFALMMKARQYNRRIFDKKIMPNLYSMKESKYISTELINFVADGDVGIKNELSSICTDLENAKECGSIINVQKVDFEKIYNRIDEITGEFYDDLFKHTFQRETIELLLPIIKQAEAMTTKFHVVCTNPPYLGNSRYSKNLNDYILAYYPEEKADLAMVMLKKMLFSMVEENGFVAAITTVSWMFLKSFQKFRENVIMNKDFICLCDFGTELFDGKIGHLPVASWVNRNSKTNQKMVSIRLVDYCYSRRNEKENEFFNKENWHYIMPDLLHQIPGSPIAYWVNESFANNYNERKIEDYAEVITGMTIGDNNKYLRLWYEISKEKMAVGRDSMDDIDLAKTNWIPYSKGGNRRNWYGNYEYVVNWAQKDNFNRSKTTLQHLYLKEALTWPFISMNKFSARLLPKGFLWDVAGSPCFFNNIEDEYYALGLMCSKVTNYILNAVNPTVNVQAADVAKIPMIVGESCIKQKVIENVKECIDISQKDWDSFETSWEFRVHPLVQVNEVAKEYCDYNNDDGSKLISLLYNEWEAICQNRFNKVKSNEEKLNVIFNEIYGFEDKINPCVDDNDVTVRKADLERDIKSLISYFVGCIFGRYSLDCEGLVYAGGVWEKKHYTTFAPDEDNCIPITDEEYFEDDIVGLLCDWLKKVYGEKTLEENLTFIAEALGNKGKTSREIIRNYFLNDFIKDHIKMYQKRPIYWMFDSGKKNGFKALVYMHRWNADTIGNIRVDYLHRAQRTFESEINRMQDMIDHSTNNREVAAATKRKEKLQKQLKECREYDEKIGHLALSRIDIDLDDGVKVNYEKVQTASDGKKYQVLAKI